MNSPKGSPDQTNDISPSKKILMLEQPTFGSAEASNDGYYDSSRKKQLLNDRSVDVDTQSAGNNGNNAYPEVNRRNLIAPAPHHGSLSSWNNSKTPQNVPRSMTKQLLQMEDVNPARKTVQKQKELTIEAVKKTRSNSKNPSSGIPSPEFKRSSPGGVFKAFKNMKPKDVKLIKKIRETHNEENNGHLDTEENEYLEALKKVEKQKIEYMRRKKLGQSVGKNRNTGHNSGGVPMQGGSITTVSKKIKENIPLYGQMHNVTTSPRDPEMSVKFARRPGLIGGTPMLSNEGDSFQGISEPFTPQQAQYIRQGNSSAYGTYNAVSSKPSSSNRNYMTFQNQQDMIKVRTKKKKTQEDLSTPSKFNNIHLQNTVSTKKGNQMDSVGVGSITEEQGPYNIVSMPTPYEIEKSKYADTDILSQSQISRDRSHRSQMSKSFKNQRNVPPQLMNQDIDVQLKERDPARAALLKKQKQQRVQRTQMTQRSRMTSIGSNEANSSKRQTPRDMDAKTLVTQLVMNSNMHSQQMIGSRAQHHQDMKVGSDEPIQDSMRDSKISRGSQGPLDTTLKRPKNEGIIKGSMRVGSSQPTSQKGLDQFLVRKNDSQIGELPNNNVDSLLGSVPSPIGPSPHSPDRKLAQQAKYLNNPQLTLMVRKAGPATNTQHDSTQDSFELRPKLQQINNQVPPINTESILAYDTANKKSFRLKETIQKQSHINSLAQSTSEFAKQTPGEVSTGVQKLISSGTSSREGSNEPVDLPYSQEQIDRIKKSILDQEIKIKPSSQIVVGQEDPSLKALNQISVATSIAYVEKNKQTQRRETFAPAFDSTFALVAQKFNAIESNASTKSIQQGEPLIFQEVIASNTNDYREVPTMDVNEMMDRVQNSFKERRRTEHETRMRLNAQMHEALPELRVPKSSRPNFSFGEEGIADIISQTPIPEKSQLFNATKITEKQQLMKTLQEFRVAQSRGDFTEQRQKYNIGDYTDTSFFSQSIIPSKFQTTNYKPTTSSYIQTPNLNNDPLNESNALSRFTEILKNTDVKMKTDTNFKKKSTIGKRRITMSEIDYSVSRQLLQTRNIILSKHVSTQQQSLKEPLVVRQYKNVGIQKSRKLQPLPIFNSNYEKVQKPNNRDLKQVKFKSVPKQRPSLFGAPEAKKPPKIKATPEYFDIFPYDPSNGTPLSQAASIVQSGKNFNNIHTIVSPGSSTNARQSRSFKGMQSGEMKVQVSSKFYEKSTGNSNNRSYQSPATVKSKSDSEEEISQDDKTSKTESNAINTGIDRSRLPSPFTSSHGPLQAMFDPQKLQNQLMIAEESVNIKTNVHSSEMYSNQSPSKQMSKLSTRKNSKSNSKKKIKQVQKIVEEKETNDYNPRENRNKIHNYLGATVYKTIDSAQKNKEIRVLEISRAKANHENNVHQRYPSAKFNQIGLLNPNKDLNKNIWNHIQKYSGKVQVKQSYFAFGKPKMLDGATQITPLKGSNRLSPLHSKNSRKQVKAGLPVMAIPNPMPHVGDESSIDQSRDPGSSVLNFLPQDNNPKTFKLVDRPPIQGIEWFDPFKPDQNFQDQNPLFQIGFHHDLGQFHIRNKAGQTRFVDIDLFMFVQQNIDGDGILQFLTMHLNQQLSSRNNPHLTQYLNGELGAETVVVIKPITMNYNRSQRSSSFTLNLEHPNHLKKEPKNSITSKSNKRHIDRSETMNFGIYNNETHNQTDEKSSKSRRQRSNTEQEQATDNGEEASSTFEKQDKDGIMPQQQVRILKTEN